MDEEGALHAHPVRDTSHGDVAAQAPARDPDHEALEDLDALARALNHPGVDPYGIAGPELGDRLLLLLLFELVDDVHGNLFAGRWMGALACARRQWAISAWLPESSTSGTWRPRNSAGLVNCGYPPPAEPASWAREASSPSTPGTSLATASTRTM